MASPWHLDITPHADGDIRKLTEVDRLRIVKALDGLLTHPPAGDIKKLQGTRDQFRLRVGDWRVVFRWDRPTRSVVVLSVDARGRAYR